MSSDLQLHLVDFSEKPVRDLVWLLESPNLLRTTFHNPTLMDEETSSTKSPSLTEDENSDIPPSSSGSQFSLEDNDVFFDPLFRRTPQYDFQPAPQQLLLPAGSLEVLKSWDADPTPLLEYLLRATSAGERTLEGLRRPNPPTKECRTAEIPNSCSASVGKSVKETQKPPKLGNYASLLLKAWFELGLSAVLGRTISVFQSVRVVKKRDYADTKILDQTSLKFVVHFGSRVATSSGACSATVLASAAPPGSQLPTSALSDNHGENAVAEHDGSSDGDPRNPRAPLYLADFPLDQARDSWLLHLEANVKFFVKTKSGGLQGPSMSESLASRCDDLARKQLLFHRMQLVEPPRIAGVVGKNGNDIVYFPSPLSRVNPAARGYYMLRGYVFYSGAEIRTAGADHKQIDEDDGLVNVNPDHLRGFLTQNVHQELGSFLLPSTGGSRFFVILPKLWWMTPLGGRRVSPTKYAASSMVGRLYVLFFGRSNVYPEKLSLLEPEKNLLNSTEMNTASPKGEALVAEVESEVPPDNFGSGFHLDVFSDVVELDARIQPLLTKQPMTPVMVAVIEARPCGQWVELSRGFVLPRGWDPENPRAHLLVVQKSRKRKATTSSRKTKVALLRSLPWGQLDERLRVFRGENISRRCRRGHTPSTVDGVEVKWTVEQQMKALENFRRAMTKRQKKEVEQEGQSTDIVAGASPSEAEDVLLDVSWLLSAMEGNDLGGLAWTTAARGLVLLWPHSKQCVDVCSSESDAIDCSPAIKKHEDGTVIDEGAGRGPSLHPLLVALLDSVEANVLPTQPAAIELWLALKAQFIPTGSSTGVCSFPGLLRYINGLSKRSRSEFRELSSWWSGPTHSTSSFGDEDGGDLHPDAADESGGDSRFLRLPYIIPVLRTKKYLPDRPEHAQEKHSPSEKYPFSQNAFIDRINYDHESETVLRPSTLFSIRTGNRCCGVDRGDAGGTTVLECGLDCEWQPSSRDRNAVAVVQLAFADRVYIIDGVDLLAASGGISRPEHEEGSTNQALSPHPRHFRGLEAREKDEDVEKAQSDLCRRVFRSILREIRPVRLIAWGTEDFRRLGLWGSGMKGVELVDLRVEFGRSCSLSEVVQDVFRGKESMWCK